MVSCWTQDDNNGHPVTVNGQRAPVENLVQVHKKSETCFTEGVEKSTEFSLHNFSNMAHFDL